MLKDMAFCHLLENSEINMVKTMVKKLMDTATKIGIDALKTASKRVVEKTAEATGGLIGNKMANKTTSVGKTKSKEKKDEANKTGDFYIPPEKRQQIIDDLRLF